MLRSIHGLYIGKPVWNYHILNILPQFYDLYVDCVVSDGNIWRFCISQHFPDLEIEEVKHSTSMWIGEMLAYRIVVNPEEYISEHIRWGSDIAVNNRMHCI